MKIAEKFKEKKVGKKLILLFVIIAAVVIIFILYFLFQKANKNLILGNNLNNKTLQEIEEYILNISSYEAKITVEVENNKNQTKYVLKQRYTSPNIEKQVVQEPSNIAGVEIIYDGNKLTINNSKLNLSTIYENYNYLTDNFLWLNSFIEQYQNGKNNGNTKLYEENNQVVMEVKLGSEHPYITNEKLVIDKLSGTISKLIVQDKNQKNLVYILYNEIKINSLKKEEVLAFRLHDFSIAQY